MASKVKTIVKCEDCKNPFKVPMGSHVSICPDCLVRKKGIQSSTY